VNVKSTTWHTIDGNPVADELERLWEALAELETAGALSERQLYWLISRDEEMPDTPVGRNLTARMLRRAIENPKQVGVIAEWARYDCPCADTGLIEVDTAGHGSYRPCERCNPGGYAIWRDCYVARCRGCDRCRPNRRARGFQGDHRAEMAQARADVERRSILDDLA
jgi:hypothetical protein